jgi:hypothetical protein
MKITSRERKARSRKRKIAAELVALRAADSEAEQARFWSKASRSAELHRTNTRPVNKAAALIVRKGRKS